MAEVSYAVVSQAVSEAQWAAWQALHLGDGVVAGLLNELAVLADASGMQVKVPTGTAHLQGYFYQNGTQATKAVTAADATNPRIDRVVLRLTYGMTSPIALAVVAGTPAGSPTAPALTRSASIYELSLAQVLVGAGVTSIAADKITDERYDPSVSGWARAIAPFLQCKSTSRPSTWPPGGVIYEQDTSRLYANTNTNASPTWTRLAKYSETGSSILTTNGDLLIVSGGAATRLAVGTAGQVLTVASSLPSWATPAVVRQMMSSAFMNGAQVGASTTLYVPLGAAIGGSASNGYSSTEAPAQVAVPFVAGATFRNLFVNTAGAQPGTGSLVLTFRKAGSDQTLTVTVAAGAGAGTASDTTHSFTAAQGDLVNLKIVNNASSAAAFFTFSYEIDPS